MACPYFMPVSNFEGGGWLHPGRLPLGAGWRGQCCAPRNEGAEPSPDELRDFCNLGYAKCPHLPGERVADAVRFSVVRDCNERLELMFVFELAHRPAGHGTLEFDLRGQRWITTHPEARTQKMAQCYIEAYLLRRSSSTITTWKARSDS